jgi:hypothetical protein
MYPQAYDRIRTEPEVLDADMTPADIVDTLKRLHFTSGMLTIKLDKDVRDFLVAAVIRQGERSRNDLFSEARQPADIVRPP